MRSEVVAGRSATIAVQLYSGEKRVDSTTGATVEVRRADGTEVLPAGTATTKPDGTVGRYERVLTPAQLPEVDLLTAIWTVTLDGAEQTRRTTVEVVGAHYFELAELRTMPGLSSSKYSTDALAEARTRAQDEIERDVGAAFVERFGTVTLTGGGYDSIRVRPWLRRILGITSAGVALSQAELDALSIYPSGELVRASGVFGSSETYRDVVVRYVHGWSDEPPIDVRDAALELARHHALGWRSFLPDDPVDAEELGRETAAGEAADRRQGQDQIDSVIASWREQLGGYRHATSVPIV